jgi:hypothetical protein
MRKLIAAIVLAAAACGTASAEAPRAEEKSGSALFSEDGIYIAPGESHEVVIAGDCRLLTNRDSLVAYFITPAKHKSWPEVWVRDAREPIVTEAPCK